MRASRSRGGCGDLPRARRTCVRGVAGRTRGEPDRGGRTLNAAHRRRPAAFGPGIVPCLLACALCGCGPPPEPSRRPTERDAATARDTAAGREHAGPPPAAESPFEFRTVAAEAGLDFARNDDIRGLRRILEANGGGVGLLDFDRDGRPDVFFVNGCRLPLGSGVGDDRGELFRNAGEMRFEAAAAPAGLVQRGYGHGCAVADFDADGFEDVYGTAYGPDSLWRNNGDGTFGDVSRPAGVGAPGWGASAAFGDLDGDGDLDLYVANYLDESDEAPTLCPNPKSPDGYSQCPPSLYDGVDDVVYLSDGAGGFADATAATGVAGLRGKGLGVVVADLGGDPRPEVFVANDGEANFLLAPAGPPDGPLRYEDRALTSGVALNESGYAQANMGVAAGDYDADGHTDFLVTHFFGDTSTLFDGRGDLAFDDATRLTGLGPPSRDRLGWGTVFFDADNDGWLDLFVANGHVDDRTFMSHDEPYRMRAQVFRNRRDGAFADVSAGAGDYFEREWLGRGVAAGDVDRDGRVDLAVSHQLAPSVVLRNVTPTEHRCLWLHLAGVTSNRTAVGARVELEGTEAVAVREVVGGGSYLSASAPDVHLGLGETGDGAVRIRWPSGRSQRLRIPAGRWLVVEGRPPLPIR